MTILPESARALVESGRLGHVVTLNADGSPQVSCVWIAMDGGSLVSCAVSSPNKARVDGWLERDGRRPW